MNIYKLRFLVSTDSWENTKKYFHDELGITKDKKDDTVVSIRGHYVVEIDMHLSDLTDKFYRKVEKSKHISILSDEYSLENAQTIIGLVAPVELQLRELAVYAFDLAATYQDSLSLKHQEAKKYGKDSLILPGDLNPLLAYFDFGDLINFLGKTGNVVNDSNVADDTARLIEVSKSFEEFQVSFIKKFKRLTIWDTIAKVVLVQYCAWDELEDDLIEIKNIRNIALHYRSLTPSDVRKAQELSTKVATKIIRKSKPARIDEERLSITFKSFNDLFRSDSYQKHMQALIDASRISEQINAAASIKLLSSLDVPASKFTKLNIPISPLQQIAASLNALGYQPNHETINHTKHQVSETSSDEDAKSGSDTSKSQEPGEKI